MKGRKGGRQLSLFPLTQTHKPLLIQYVLMLRLLSASIPSFQQMDILHALGFLLVRGI